MYSGRYKGRYKGGSKRLKGWDYSSAGLYFLTIVTQDRECNLGAIENNQMILSDFGKIVDDEWNHSFDLRKELFLHIYVIMPNHLHCIVEIDPVVKSHGRAIQPRAIQPRTILQQEPTQSDQSNPSNMPYRLPKSISSFMAGFKSAVNSKIDDYIDKHQLPIPKYNRHNQFFQPNYHDHIIRNEIEYDRIKNYIMNNPSNWGNDQLR